MKLDPDLIHYLTKEHFRVLTAVEMGMKNHQYVPVPLIESLAALKRGNAYKIIQFLLKHKLIMHMNKVYDGYALTYGGYDYLAIKAFMKRGFIKSIGIKIGVGKESDIYLCESPEGETMVIKLARLGRTSFRTVKSNRDYLKGRSNYSWLYLSRIASLKEFAFMKALYGKQFPTPVPIDSSRHAIVMSFIRAYPMSQVKELAHPEKVYEQLLEQIIRLAEHGLIHGDFNEFNLLIDDDENITIIDFPQMTSTSHPNAQFYFARDVVCIQDFFEKRFGLRFEGVPILAQDIDKANDLDREIRASGFSQGMEEADQAAFDTIHEHYLDKEPDSSSDSQEEVIEEVQEEGDTPKERVVRFQDEKEDSSDESVDTDQEEIKQKLPKKEKLPGETKTKKKMIVNEEYVKDRVKKQYWTNERKKMAKRNRNKDKKVMKAQECIKDYFVDAE